MDLRKYRDKIGFFVLLISIALVWFLGSYFHFDLKSYQHTLARLPLYYSGLIYVILYVVVTFFVFFSKDVFWITAAMVFGPLFGTIFICIAEVINAFILFYLARLFGRSYVEKKAGEKYRWLDEKLARINLFWLFIFRAAPLIPYRFLDLAAGLTRIDFKKYLIAVILGTPLKMYWIEYILYGVGANIMSNPQLMVEYFAKNKNITLFSFIYVILVIMAAFKIKTRD